MADPGTSPAGSHPNHQRHPGFPMFGGQRPSGPSGGQLLGDPGPLLMVQGVSKYFGGVQAVRNVTFTVDRGECVGLVGPNGAGKTTLFNCVCGQLRPEEGTVEFAGMELGRMPTFRP